MPFAQLPPLLRLESPHSAPHDPTRLRQVCPSNTYNENEWTGASTCDTCSDGKTITDDGVFAAKHDSRDDCESCAEGEYLVNATTGECAPCAAGRYQPDTTSPIEACEYECPAGTFLQDDGQNAEEHDSASDCEVFVVPPSPPPPPPPRRRDHH